MQQRQNDARRNKENHTTMHPKESSNKTNADKLTSSLVPAVFFFFFVEFFFFFVLSQGGTRFVSVATAREAKD
jgi:heme/copper-type cytochrome/quinol oxidase subunit 2